MIWSTSFSSINIVSITIIDNIRRYIQSRFKVYNNFVTKKKERNRRTWRSFYSSHLNAQNGLLIASNIMFYPHFLNGIRYKILTIRKCMKANTIPYDIGKLYLLDCICSKTIHTKFISAAYFGHVFYLNIRTAVTGLWERSLAPRAPMPFWDRLDRPGLPFRLAPNHRLCTIRTFEECLDNLRLNKQIP